MPGLVGSSWLFRRLRLDGEVGRCDLCFGLPELHERLQLDYHHHSGPNHDQHHDG